MYEIADSHGLFAKEWLRRQGLSPGDSPRSGDPGYVCCGQIIAWPNPYWQLSCSPVVGVSKRFSMLMTKPAHTQLFYFADTQRHLQGPA